MSATTAPLANESRDRRGPFFSSAGGRGPLRAGFGLVLTAVALFALLPAGSRLFISDRTLQITSPAPLSLVNVPFDVTWSARPAPGRQYAVFVDLAPIRPGSSLRQLSLQSCKAVSTCQPAASYLAGIGVYVTASDRVTVETLQPVGGFYKHQKHQVHELTIVEMDLTGHRVGSSAWELEFRA